MYADDGTSTKTFAMMDDAILRFHSQLEIAPLLEHFAQWASVAVSFSSLHYRHLTLGLFDVPIQAGACLDSEYTTYPLAGLGTLHFLRKEPFEQHERELLAQCVDILRLPLHNAVLYHSVVRQCDGLTQRLSANHEAFPPFLQEGQVSDAELQEALCRDDFTIFYQPKVDLKSGTVKGLEALLRWHHPYHGLLSPEQFIPMAERNGFIQAITRWVLNTVLRQCAEWQQLGLLVPVAVNLSGIDLEDTTLPDHLEQLLQAWEIPAQFIELEITETAAIADHPRCIDILRRLTALGVTVAIDDFGIGYSSLQRLKHLPVDTIKIDKSFVMEEGRGENDVLFVDTIVRLGHQLGKKVVAEGVDCRESWQRLLTTSCDMAQGYHISQPLSVEAITTWLRDGVSLSLALPIKPNHTTGAPEPYPA